MTMTQRMTIEKDATDKERLLDNFPVTEWELDRLMDFYNACVVSTTNSKEGEDGNTILLSQICQQLESRHPVVNDDDTSKNTSAFWVKKLQHVERDILPDVASPQWFCQDAPKLVSPLLPYDITLDKTPDMYRAFYFLEAMVSLLGRRGTRFLINFMYDSVVEKQQQQQQPTGEDDKQPVGVEADALVDLVYRHVRAALYLQDTASTATIESPKEKQSAALQTPKPWVVSLQQAAASASGTGNDSTSTLHIARPVWNEWIQTTLSESTRGLSTFYHCILFSPSHPFGPTSPPPLSLPHPDCGQHGFWNHPSDLLPLSLGCMSPVLGGNWYRLYSSHWDGLSFLTLQKALLGYVGPTAMLIRRKGNKNNKGVFGYYTDCPWRDSSHGWYGGEGHDSFLFKVDRDLNVFYPTYEANGLYHMYLNSESSLSSCVGNNNPLRGLAIGGISSDTPRIHLTLSLERCQATSTDTTYTPGPLVDPDDDEGIASPYFDVEEIEVWAVNVASKDEFLKNVQEGQKRWSRKEVARQHAAQVDRSQFLDDFKSGTVLNKLFCHREEARGRHDFVAAPKRGSGYFVEEHPPSKRLIKTESSGDISFSSVGNSSIEDDEKEPDVFESSS